MVVAPPKTARNGLLPGSTRTPPRQRPTAAQYHAQSQSLTDFLTFHALLPVENLLRKGRIFKDTPVNSLSDLLRCAKRTPDLRRTQPKLYDAVHRERAVEQMVHSIANHTRPRGAASRSVSPVAREHEAAVSVGLQEASKHVRRAQQEGDRVLYDSILKKDAEKKRSDKEAMRNHEILLARRKSSLANISALAKTPTPAKPTRPIPAQSPVTPVHQMCVVEPPQQLFEAAHAADETSPPRSCRVLDVTDGDDEPHSNCGSRCATARLFRQDDDELLGSFVGLLREYLGMEAQGKGNSELIDMFTPNEMEEALVVLGYATSESDRIKGLVSKHET